ncbi:MAG: hypothetical protein ACOYNC_03765 [Bacteroidales bacterium]
MRNGKKTGGILQGFAYSEPDKLGGRVDGWTGGRVDRLWGCAMARPYGQPMVAPVGSRHGVTKPQAISTH